MAREFLPQRQEAVTIGEKCAFRSLNSGFGRRLLIFAPWTVVVRGFFNLKRSVLHMKAMEKKILEEGKVLPGGILKVGSFLNQQIDTSFLGEMAKEFARLYADAGVNKVLTIESSGIAIAAAVALEMGVPMVFAKKHKSSNVDGKVYTAVVHSYTHGTDYTIVVSSDYLGENDRVLLVDDFLANGKALVGLTELVRQAGGTVVGAAIAIEKGFQGGGDALRAEGVRVESLAIVDSMTDDAITFRN
jgi:xanthine phosphoribosyltransferase